MQKERQRKELFRFAKKDRDPRKNTRFPKNAEVEKFENAPSRTGHGHSRTHYRNNHFTNNAAIRWLAKNVGRPWRLVYSEMKEKYGEEYEALMQRIETKSHRDENNDTIIDGEYGTVTPETTYTRFYVTPEGLLAHCKKRKKYKYVPKPEPYLIGQDCIWYRYKGIVYKASTANQTTVETTRFQSAKTAKTPTGVCYRKSAKKENHIPQKDIRQASSKEIRDLGPDPLTEEMPCESESTRWTWRSQLAGF